MAFLGREPVATVEQNSIEIDIAVAKINWLGEEFSVQVLVSETNEALIGTELLAAALLEIDYKNRTVKITK